MLMMENTSRLLTWWCISTVGRGRTKREKEWGGRRERTRGGAGVQSGRHWRGRSGSWTGQGEVSGEASQKQSGAGAGEALTERILAGVGSRSVRTRMAINGGLRGT